MIDLQYIKSFYPRFISDNKAFDKHILKEYVELLALDYLSSQTRFLGKIAFIGGTCLRLAKGINRWSEDLDFDCKNLSHDEFMEMTDGIAAYLRSNGLNAQVRDKENSKLTAYRRSIYFPGLLFDLDLTGHREERFLMKVEAQDQGVDYNTEMISIDRNGFHINIPAPPDEILLAMKFSALLSRSKGRDFYDTMFLLQTTQPSYEFLKAREDIEDREALLNALTEKISNVDMTLKSKDFTHLLHNPADAERINDFMPFVKSSLR